jgi:hypothetical protein
MKPVSVRLLVHDSRPDPGLTGHRVTWNNAAEKIES